MELKQIQEKIKQYAVKRDQIIGEIGREEGQLENAYTKLRELGIETPENLSVEELEALATDAQNQLAEKLAAIESQLVLSESLIAQYQQLQES